MKTTWREWFALTKTERKVGLFLVGSFFLGLLIRLYQETFPTTPGFDYRVSDSTFAALSSASVDDSTSKGNVESRQKIGLNSATKRELMSLPGIGEVTAERILTYREEQGPFRSVEDLRNIKGISKLRLAKLKPLVTVN